MMIEYTPLLMIALFVTVVVLAGSIVIVRQQSVLVIELFGRFWALRQAGLGLKPPPPFGRVVGEVSLRVRDLASQVEVKTADNVFIRIPVAVQFRVIPERAADAFYTLTNPAHQIESFILNVVRSAASVMTLEQVYTEKNRIAAEVEAELSERLAGYGHRIEAILIDQPLPPPEVQAAFNRVISAQRAQEAAKMEGEAVRIRMVAEAEAEKQSKQLQGEGIAAQRRAIADGFHEAVMALKSAMPQADEALIVATLLATNQFDAIREASNKPASLILMPYSGDAAVGDIARLAAAIRAFSRGEAPGGQITASGPWSTRPDPA